jgi:hypothetical protein
MRRPVEFAVEGSPIEDEQYQTVQLRKQIVDSVLVYQNISLSVNCAERGPPTAYRALCPFGVPPPSMFVVDVPGQILPKAGLVRPCDPQKASGLHCEPGIPNIGWLNTLL